MLPLPRFSRIVKRPHRVYDVAEIMPILEYLSNPVLPQGAIQQIFRDTGIPISTLSDWHSKRVNPETADWVPLAEGHPRKRALPPAVEQAVADMIRTDYIRPGKGGTRKTIASLATNAYASLPIDEMRLERFAASSRFVDGFMKRQYITLRMPHAERRTHINPDRVADFLRTLENAKAIYRPDRIFNFDETCWKCCLTPAKVLAEKGTDTVKLLKCRNEKESYTAYGCISAAGDKLPCWIIAKGKTDRSHRKFGDHPQVEVRHTPSGWTTEDMMCEYVRWLSQCCAGEPLFLVMDLYSAHRTAKLQGCARELNVTLEFIPAGATSILQPLDRRIFGELKARARADFARRTWQNGGVGVPPSEAVEILVQAWDKIPADHVRRAWNLQ